MLSSIITFVIVIGLIALWFRGFDPNRYPPKWTWENFEKRKGWGGRKCKHGVNENYCVEDECAGRRADEV